VKYAVDILTKAEGSLEDDNLKGERRWERQAARALLDAGREVGAPRDSWDRPDTSRWLGTVGDLSGYALITHGDPGTVRYRPGAEAFISNVFCGLTAEAEAEIRRAVAELGRRRVALTHSFQLNVALKRLPPDLHDLIHWVPVPAVASVNWDSDPFNNKVLLWSTRAISFRLIRPLQSILDLLDWIRQRLVEDRDLRFEVLASEERMNQEEADRWVWGFPAFEEAFRDVRGQVVIHPSIHWSEVQKVFSRTKMIVNDPVAFGGPAIEAASFGIPFVGRAFSSFHVTDPASARWPGADDAGESRPAFPEFVEVGCVAAGVGGAGSATLSYPRFVDQLDVWFRDGEAYRRAGNAYRRYVDATYTNAAFVRYLDALPAFV
jgi:hypothetical protein